MIREQKGTADLALLEETVRCLWTSISALSIRSASAFFSSRINPPESNTISGSRPAIGQCMARIVSDEAWQAVEERIAVREGKISIASKAAWSRRGSQSKYLLSGLLVCAVCSSRFTISGINRSQRYICGSHTNGGVHACSNGIHVARETAERTHPAGDGTTAPQP